MIRLASSPDPYPGSAALNDFSTRSQGICFSQASLGAAPTCVDAQPVQSPSSPLAKLMPHAQAPLQVRLLDIGIADWNELFRAVEARLTATVGKPLSMASEVKPGDVGSRVQDVVLECVTALEQLHTALTHERGMRHQLEMEVFDAQTALAWALAENAGTPSTKIQVRDHQLPGQSSTQGVDAPIESMPSCQGLPAMLQPAHTAL